MDHDQALAFLAQHQPLPDQHEASMMNQYREVLAYLAQNPDPRCLPLILTSAGLWEDVTIYDLINKVLDRYGPEEVIPHIKNAFGSPYPSVRFAAADVAMHFPDPTLIEPLTELLGEGIAIIRLAAVAALEQIGGDEVKALIGPLALTENDEEILEIMDSILN